MNGEGDPSAVERRMLVVRAVRQIVHAIWALARAQLPLAEKAAADATTYLDWVDQVTARLAGRPRHLPAAETFFVVIGPQRAYCGGLPRKVAHAIPPDGELGLVGARLIEIASELPEVAPRVRFALPSAATHDEHEETSRALAEAVLTHARHRVVELLYPVSVDGALRSVVLLAGPREALPSPPDHYAPLPALVGAAVSEGVGGRLSVGLAEALRAETLARIAASERAKTACDASIDELQREWRVARQQEITAEILEVVAGREASGAGASSP